MGGEQVAGSIGERLVRVARRVPDRVAIVERGVERSYAELDAAGDAIAHRPHTLPGVGSGFIALLFETKVPAIEAIFGASRGGRAYVPLDAGDPDDRLRLILKDSEPTALLTERSLLARARSLASAECAVLAIEDIQPTGGRGLPRIDEDALANLYYTSGSTGAPKGVCQSSGMAVKRSLGEHESGCRNRPGGHAGRRPYRRLVPPGRPTHAISRGDCGAAEASPSRARARGPGNGSLSGAFGCISMKSPCRGL